MCEYESDWNTFLILLLMLMVELPQRLQKLQFIFLLHIRNEVYWRTKQSIILIYWRIYPNQVSDWQQSLLWIALLYMYNIVARECLFLTPTWQWQVITN